MATRIGLVSDVHARPGPLEQALELFAASKVDRILCAGDIAGYYDSLSPTIHLLQEHACDTIIGNHDQIWVESHADERDTENYAFLNALPATLEYETDGKRIYVVHAHPPDSQHGGIKLLDVEGERIPEQVKYWETALAGFDSDVLVVGHTHQVYAEKLGDVLVINPGSSAFNHSCAILELPSLKVRFFALEGKEILKSWNFSMLYGSDSPYPPAKS